MAVLIGMSADVKGKNFTISEGEFTLGRGSDNQVALNNPTVSGHHCKITQDGERFLLTDLGSTNGTRVNAKEVKESPVVLKPKDLVQIGSVEFLFNSEEIIATEENVEARTETQVVVSSGAATAPRSFESISPFGARRQDNPRAWTAVIIIVGLLALAGVGYLVYTLIKL
jgi:pSer/pThr/pTyr-binding forkhead associated (FHA) protein